MLFHSSQKKHKTNPIYFQAQRSCQSPRQPIVWASFQTQASQFCDSTGHPEVYPSPFVYEHSDTSVIDFQRENSRIKAAYHHISESAEEQDGDIQIPLRYTEIQVLRRIRTLCNLSSTFDYFPMAALGPFARLLKFDTPLDVCVQCRALFSRSVIHLSQSERIQAGARVCSGGWRGLASAGPLTGGPLWGAEPGSSLLMRPRFLPSTLHFLFSFAPLLLLSLIFLPPLHLPPLFILPLALPQSFTPFVFPHPLVSGPFPAFPLFFFHLSSTLICNSSLVS